MIQVLECKVEAIHGAGRSLVSISTRTKEKIVCPLCQPVPLKVANTALIIYG